MLEEFIDTGKIEKLEEMRPQPKANPDQVEWFATLTEEQAGYIQDYWDQEGEKKLVFIQAWVEEQRSRRGQPVERDRQGPNRRDVPLRITLAPVLDQGDVRVGNGRGLHALMIPGSRVAIAIRSFRNNRTARSRWRFASQTGPGYHCIEGIPLRENARPALKHNEIS